MILSIIRLTRIYYTLPLSLGLAVIAMYVRAGQIADIAGKLIAAVGALFCILNAAYAFNDIIDVEIDRINCPQRVLACGKLSIKTAFAVCIVFVVAGLALATIGGLWFYISLDITACMLLLYDMFSKKLGAFKPFAVGFITTMIYPKIGRAHV